MKRVWIFLVSLVIAVMLSAVAHASQGGVSVIPGPPKGSSQFNNGGSFGGNGAALNAAAFKGATWDVKVAACLTAACSGSQATGGTCDARGLTGSQSLAASVTIPAYCTLKLGCGTITRATGTQIILNNNDNLLADGCTTLTGTDAINGAVTQVGSAVSDIHIDGLHINTDTSGGSIAGAVGIYMPSITYSHIDNNFIMNSDTAIWLGDSGAGTYYNELYNNVARGTTNSIKFANLAQQNAVFGGQYWGRVYFSGGCCNQVYSVDTNSSPAYELGTGGNTIILGYIEGGTGILIDSGVVSNQIWGSGNITYVTDNSGNLTNIVMASGGGGGSYGVAPTAWAVQNGIFWGADWSGGGTNDSFSLLATNFAAQLELSYSGRYTTGAGGGSVIYGHSPLIVGNLLPTSGIYDTGKIQTASLANPTAPTISVVGTTGSTSYGPYRVVCHDNGIGSDYLHSNRITTTLESSASNTVSNGPASLSSGNYIQIVWPFEDGCDGWDILKTDTVTALAANIAPNEVSGANYVYRDTGQSTTGYVAPTMNATADIYGGGLITEACAGQQALSSGTPSTATVSNACISGSTNVIQCTDCSGSGAMSAPIRCVPSAGSLAITGPNIVADTVCWNRIQ